VQAAAKHLLQRRRVGRTTTRVECIDLVLLGPVNQGEGITPQACAHGLDNAKRGSGGDSRISGVSALQEHAQARLRSKRLAGGHGAAKAHDH